MGHFVSAATKVNEAPGSTGRSVSSVNGKDAYFGFQINGTHVDGRVAGIDIIETTNSTTNVTTETAILDFTTPLNMQLSGSGEGAVHQVTDSKATSQGGVTVYDSYDNPDAVRVAATVMTGNQHGGEITIAGSTGTNTHDGQIVFWDASNAVTLYLRDGALRYKPVTVDFDTRSMTLGTSDEVIAADRGAVVSYGACQLPSGTAALAFVSDSKVFVGTFTQAAVLSGLNRIDASVDNTFAGEMGVACHPDQEFFRVAAKQVSPSAGITVVDFNATGILADATAAPVQLSSLQISSSPGEIDLAVDSNGSGPVVWVESDSVQVQRVGYQVVNNTSTTAAPGTTAAPTSTSAPTTTTTGFDLETQSPVAPAFNITLAAPYSPSVSIVDEDGGKTFALVTASTSEGVYTQLINYGNITVVEPPATNITSTSAPTGANTTTPTTTETPTPSGTDEPPFVSPASSRPRPPVVLAGVARFATSEQAQAATKGAVSGAQSGAQMTLLTNALHDAGMDDTTARYTAASCNGTGAVMGMAVCDGISEAAVLLGADPSTVASIQKWGTPFASAAAELYATGDPLTASTTLARGLGAAVGSRVASQATDAAYKAAKEFASSGLQAAYSWVASFGSSKEAETGQTR